MDKSAGTISINVKVEIPDETVENCLKIIEMWLNDNPDMRIKGGTRLDNNKIESFRIYKRNEE